MLITDGQINCPKRSQTLHMLNKQTKNKYTGVITANCIAQVNLTLKKCRHKKIIPVT